MDLEYNMLDDGWINEFKNTDKLYKDFYKDDLYYINLRVIYINRENEIEKLKQESFLMNLHKVYSMPVIPIQAESQIQ